MIEAKSEARSIQDRLAEKARMDAVQDMETSPEDVERLEGVKYGWVCSYFVHNPSKDVSHHGVVRIEAMNVKEAVGYAYLWAEQKFDAHDGWGPPSLKVDNAPFLIVPGVSFPVAFDPDTENV